MQQRVPATDPVPTHFTPTQHPTPLYSLTTPAPVAQRAHGEVGAAQLRRGGRLEPVAELPGLARRHAIALRVAQQRGLGSAKRLFASGPVLHPLGPASCIGVNFLFSCFSFCCSGRCPHCKPAKDDCAPSPVPTSANLHFPLESRAHLRGAHHQHRLVPLQRQALRVVGHVDDPRPAGVENGNS